MLAAQTQRNRHIFLNMMKKTVLALLPMLVLLLVASCTSTKQVAYFQNIDSLDLSASRMLYDARIMPKDQLNITVNTIDPEAARPFNLAMSNAINSTGQLQTGGGTLLPYLVDNDGCIDFPVIGKIKVGGLTKNECQDLIKEKISPYLQTTEKPVVTVRMSSFRVVVEGEVNNPSVVQVSSEKMSLLEAIAQAGDLTIYGKRTNVLLIREDSNGQKSQHRIDLTNANFINSPYYYVQQNDIIYVEPNKAKARNSDIGQSTTLIFSVVGTLISIASLIVNILR